ncbi:MAG: hypothetical protein ACRYFZ_09690 [Janthinobacterium lividum]
MKTSPSLSLWRVLAYSILFWLLRRVLWPAVGLAARAICWPLAKLLAWHIGTRPLPVEFEDA